MRLGLLGGTFDPIHLAHLLLAEQSRDQLQLDRVLLIPASRPPHKPRRPISPYDLRLRMVESAVRGIGGFEASDLERNPGQPSYTVETLRRLRSRVEVGSEFWLILGSDSLRDLPNWREPEEVAKLAGLAVYPRPGAPKDPPSLPGARIEWLDGPSLQLSATEIRRRVREGRSIRFLVPEGVRRLIESEELYRSESEEQ